MSMPLSLRNSLEKCCLMNDTLGHRCLMQKSMPFLNMSTRCSLSVSSCHSLYHLSQRPIRLASSLSFMLISFSVIPKYVSRLQKYTLLISYATCLKKKLKKSYKILSETSRYRYFCGKMWHSQLQHKRYGLQETSHTTADL